MEMFNSRICDKQLALHWCVAVRAGEPANVLAAPAPDFFHADPAPDFFFQAAPAPAVFFERLRLQGAKNTRQNILFPRTSKVKLQKI